ncbi:glycosyltransferase family 4 protein [Pseudomonas saudiphocaensis]|uniref:Glycosyltransferase n=1 Tax=Pseudomonas saudiphocaensis TaxID=1499686 RepID=A0A078LQ21_9PSED|nr:glycosyltransferase family 4 protein [Pseudomonas saudiphocaensis]CDZ94623.1 hypothetical protein BN1079_01947 [Pseudomonas saudiphocaensis]
MKILHLCLASFYIDNASYQENLLPRYHKRLGYEVEILASPDVFDVNGKLIISEAPRCYFNEDGIKVRRLRYVHNLVDHKLKRFKGVYESLKEFEPDVLFIHGCQFLDMFSVVRYLKNNSAKVFVDNHADFSNSGRSFISKYLLHRVVWRACAQAILPFVERFYGVLPSRVDFLSSEYKVPLDKIELLLMGADDDCLSFPRSIIDRLRARFSLSSDAFLIVTGGKIDNAKLEVLELMRAVAEFEGRVKLIVFGSVLPEIKDKFDCLLNEHVIYAGWVTPEESFHFFELADLVVFPGRHSVFWEQVVAQKKPMLVKYWPGSAHIDLGGNVIFLERSDFKEIKGCLENILEDACFFSKMKASARSDESEKFLYSNIARQSLGLK